MRRDPLHRLALVLLFGLAFAPATLRAEPQPGDACPTVDHFMRVAGPENPGSGHFLYCNESLVWQPILRFQSDGHVIFNSSGLPAAPLHVWGEAIIGSEGLACAAATEGAIRYDSSGNIMELCDGTSWLAVNTGAGGMWTDNATHISYASAHMIASGQALPAGFDADGARLFWYPDKQAFRGGAIQGIDGSDVWQDVNIGRYSFAYGMNTQASGIASTAMGVGTTASGNFSTAMGRFSSAGGLQSTALGGEALALGDHSLAIGLGDSSGGHPDASMPQVSGESSFGIFMGDQSGIDLASANTMAVMGGDVGIGTVAPAAPLEVAGEIKFSSSGLGCGAAQEGAVRYTGGDPPWEFCDGSAWVNFKQPRCQDDDTGECYLDATRSNDDPEFIADNIADGVNVLGVTGSFGALSQAGTITSAELDTAVDTAVAGDYAYVASFAAGLTVIDISNPAAPAQVGAISSGILDSSQGVAVAGNYAYVTGFSAARLTVIDISDPANPAQAGTITSADLNGAWGVAIAGDYAYVASIAADSLTVIDISNPAAPAQVGTISSAALNGAQNVAVAGRYTYVASRDADSLTVIDISDPAAPAQVGTITSADLDFAIGVAVAGNYAYIASTLADSLTVIDISNSAAPAQVGTITSADLDGAQSVAVAGDYAYVASGTADSLTVIDISDPANPAQTGTISGTALNGAQSVAVAGNYAYIASSTADSLTVIDLAGTYKAAEYFDCTNDNLDTCVLDRNRSKYDTDFKPQNIADGVNVLGVTGSFGALAQTGTVTSAALDSARRVAIAGDYAYVASWFGDSLTVIDISDPANPAQAGTVTSADLNGAVGVAVAGDYAYVASSTADSLSVIDISDPANPAQTGTVSTIDMDSAQSVAVAGDYAYVASYDADSLTVIDISDPANPSQTGTVSTADLYGASGVAVVGDYAYVSGYFADSLTVIDISDPANPAQIGTVSTADLDLAADVAVAGDYAYVASANANSLTVIDISDPANPAQTGTVSSADLGVASGVAVAGNYAYVAGNGADSLSVIDISDPANPAQAGTVTSADLNGAYGVVVAGNYAYVAASNADSLTVIDLAGTYKAAEYFDCTNDNLDTCVLDQNRSKYDTDFKPQNIVSGVNILGVTGTASGGLSGPSGCASIGDLCADGTVFAGWHPITQEHLFIPPADQGTTSHWKTSTGTDDIATDSTYDGRANTNQVANSTTFPAFKLCKDLGTGGHADWYLPSQVELYYLWAVHETIEAGGNITNFQNALYWSSTEYSTSNAWIQTFPSGNQYNTTKDTAYRVRCVRR